MGEGLGVVPHSRRGGHAAVEGVRCPSLPSHGRGMAFPWSECPCGSAPGSGPAVVGRLMGLRPDWKTKFVAKCSQPRSSREILDFWLFPGKCQVQWPWTHVATSPQGSSPSLRPPALLPIPGGPARQQEQADRKSRGFCWCQAVTRLGECVAKPWAWPTPGPQERCLETHVDAGDGME